METNITLKDINDALGVLIAANALACFGGETFMAAVDVAICVMRATLAANEILDPGRITEASP